MPEFASPRIIRPANGRDIEALKAAFPKQDQAKYADRLARQADNHNLFLLAVQEDVPVGYVFVKWEGAKDDVITGKLPVTTPDLEDLFVHEEHRNRRVASRLLETAEQLAATRGYKQIGLSCSKDNTDAFALYEQRGYVDAGLEPYDLSGTYTDAEGKEQEWREQNCVYLVRSLSSPATATEMETNMTNNESTTTETTDNAEATTTTEPSEEKKPTNEKPLSDQVVDFAFGVALTAAEVLEKAVEAISEKAKVAQKEAPAVWESLQEKGRPAREKLVQSLREEAREEAEAATAATAAKTEETAATPTATGETPAPAPIAEVKPAPRPFGFGRSSNLSAEEEIKALEERVKTLESEVAVAPAPVVEAEAKAPESEVQLESGVVSEIAITEDAVNAAEPTPAESGTTLVDFTPDTADASTLSASAYAITDDEERAAVPSQAGELSEIEPDSVPSVTKPRKSKKVTEAAGDAPVESEEPAA